MSDDEDEDRRRRGLIGSAAGSTSLTPEQRSFLLGQLALLESGGQPTDEQRKTTRLLVGKAASP